MDTERNKAKLRNLFRQRRQRLSPQHVQQASQQTVERLKLAEDWSLAKKLHTYYPLENRNEIDVTGFVEWLRREYPHVRIYSSRVNGNILENIQINQDTVFEYDKFGLPAPRGKADNAVKFDVIIVPCLAADKQGYRLGYGGGFYDHFLATQPRAHKIGICYSAEIVDKLPRETHDQKLDLILSEIGIV